jgi:hypothetical protein
MEQISVTNYNNIENKKLLYEFLNKKFNGLLLQNEYDNIFESYLKLYGNLYPNVNDFNSNFLQFFLQKYKTKRKLVQSNNLSNQNQNPNQNFINNNQSVLDQKYFQPQVGYSKNSYLNKNQNPNQNTNSNANDSNLVENYDSKLNSNNELNSNELNNNNNESQCDEVNKSFDKTNIFSQQFELMDKKKFYPEIQETNDQNFYIICNSRDRDFTKYPFHDYFQIEFSQPIKNIKEIKCENIILPNLNYFDFEPFLFLQLNEIDQLFIGSTNYYSNMFAQILPICALSSQKFITCFPSKTKKKYYINPISSLARLTVRLCSSNGKSLPLPTDVFQVVQIENSLFNGNSVYKITMLNQPRNLNQCFFTWLKESMHIFDPIYISGIPEIRQQLYYLNFEKYDSYDCSNIILYASPLKITCQLFSNLDFTLFRDSCQTCFCSFNKMAITILLKIKTIDIENKIIHSQIVK